MCAAVGPEADNIWTRASRRINAAGLSVLSFDSVFLCRMYPIKEVPLEAEALTNWLYQRFVEKEQLLAHFYDTGESRHVIFVQLERNE